MFIHLKFYSQYKFCQILSHTHLKKVPLVQPILATGNRQRRVLLWKRDTTKSTRQLPWKPMTTEREVTLTCQKFLQSLASAESLQSISRILDKEHKEMLSLLYFSLNQADLAFYTFTEHYVVFNGKGEMDRIAQLNGNS